MHVNTVGMFLFKEYLQCKGHHIPNNASSYQCGTLAPSYTVYQSVKPGSLLPDTFLRQTRWNDSE